MSRSATPQQVRYVDGIVQGMNQKEAAVYAGYSPHNAEYQSSMLQKNPKVMAVLDERRREIVKGQAFTTDAVLQGLFLNAVLAREAKHFGASNRALELLGKALGLWRDEPTQIMGDVNVLIVESLTKLNAMPNDVLRGLAGDLVSPPEDD